MYLKGLSEGVLLFQRVSYIFKKKPKKWSTRRCRTVPPTEVCWFMWRRPAHCWPEVCMFIPSFLQRRWSARENFLEKPVHQWDLSKSIAKFQRLHAFYFVQHRARGSYRRFVSILESESTKLLENTSVDDDYKTFRQKRRDKLNEQCTTVPIHFQLPRAD
jgi:hypothetical protein